MSEEIADGPVDLHEVASDDAFIDFLAAADARILDRLCERGGPLTAMLAAWAAGVRED